MIPGHHGTGKAQESSPALLPPQTPGKPPIPREKAALHAQGCSSGFEDQSVRMAWSLSFLLHVPDALLRHNPAPIPLEVARSCSQQQSGIRFWLQVASRAPWLATSPSQPPRSVFICTEYLFFHLLVPLHSDCIRTPVPTLWCRALDEFEKEGKRN